MNEQDYRARLQFERRIYQDCAHLEDLPEIFHYWSNRHIAPKLAVFGFSGPKAMFVKYLDEHCARDQAPQRFVSVGSGNCDLEIEFALRLRENGRRDFVIECIDMNTAMLDRGRAAAIQSAVEGHLEFHQADFNEWEPEGQYHAVIANQSLHHCLRLEHLFTQIKRSLKPGGRFLISDMIGRNGHQLEPPALRILHEFWRELPPSYRFDRRSGQYEELYVDRDHSRDGFEAIRSQDILPLLIEHFHFELFVGFGNIINPLVDRSFGPNFDPAKKWDRHFIDRVHARDEQEIAAGRIAPTHMVAVVRNEPLESIPVKPSTVDQTNRAPSPVVENIDAYHWGSWPHDAQSELEIACRRLASAAQRIERLKEDLEAEVRARTEWALQLEKDLKVRTAWALLLKKECEETAESFASLQNKLKNELELRTKWALQLDKDYAERTAWAVSLENDLQKLNDEMERTQFARKISHMFHGAIRRLRKLLPR